MNYMNLETNAKKLNMIMESMNSSLCERLVHNVFMQAGMHEQNWELLNYLKCFPVDQLKLSLKYSKRYQGIDDMDASKELRDAANALQETALGEYFFKSLSSDLSTEQVIKIVNETMSKIVLGYYVNEESKEVYNGSTDGVKALTNFYLVLNQMLCGLDQELRDNYYNEWHDALFRPGYDRTKTENGHFLVHFIQCPADAWNSKHFWSCSYISKISPNAFSDRKYGLLFNPRVEEIIGMAPTDLQTQMQCPDYLYDDIGNLLSFMFHEIHFDNKNLVTYGHLGDMLSVYPMRALALETCKNDNANYNEVILSGTTYPTGVFVFKEFYEKLKNDLFALCYSQRLPLVVYDDSLDVITCIPTRFITCSVEFSFSDGSMLP